MAKNLVVVESPAKAKTISQYLGPDYVVEASVGHVRDLPPKALGVDIERGFVPTYRVIKSKEDVIRRLHEKAQESDLVYLATDPDREGEAIAWHVAAAAGFDEDRLRRVTFHQVTKRAVREALERPRSLDEDLIDAQQARRVLDRLVGYQISPLLSRAMRKRLSAGRVQSVALRLVVDREREIQAFVPEEYWTLDALLQRRTLAKEQFAARLFRVAGQEPDLHSRADVDTILTRLEAATYQVSRVKKGNRQRRPQPPFITSTLQAEAGRKLGFAPRKTMRIAQQLYEGIDLNGERVGLITYMRTDSTQVAPEAQAEARQYILGAWGDAYLPERAPTYRSKVASAQEAHEAIRPTSVLRVPEEIRSRLTRDQCRLYELIWRRFLASQMNPARYDTLTLDIVAADDFVFRATGQELTFAGYLVVYEEGKDAAKEEPKDLPEVSEGEILDLVRLQPEQHFTQPPARYNEPTLIRALESHGVGRPSTYASMVSVIQDRGYVVRENRRLAPTSIGMVVCDALVATFGDIMDLGYTAAMEQRLDDIASGSLAYVTMLTEFYQGFERELASAKDNMAEVITRALWNGLPESLQGRTCPECGKALQVRVSGAGRFLGCLGYPDCRYTLDLSDPENPRELEFAEGEICEKCGGRMKIIIRGRSKFLGCENYPKCRNTRPILSDKIKRLAAEMACPECGHQPMEPRSGRYGEYLFCSTCEKNFSLRKLAQAGIGVETVGVPCPECGHTPLEKRAGRYGPYYRCPNCHANISVKRLRAALEAAGKEMPPEG